MLTTGEKHHIALNVFKSFDVTSIYLLRRCVVLSNRDYWLLVIPSNGQGYARGSWSSPVRRVFVSLSDLRQSIHGSDMHPGLGCFKIMNIL